MSYDTGSEQASVPGNGNASPSNTSPRGDKSYDSMMKSLMHASNEKSVMLQEIQSLKAQLKQSKRDTADLQKELQNAKINASQDENKDENARQRVIEKITAFYTEHNPERLGTLDRLLTKYEGKEQLMLEELHRKYNVVYVPEDKPMSEKQAKPSLGSTYSTPDGTAVVVVAASEMLSNNKLLETNLRTGIMATLWAIKAQLTKRLCGAFARWRLVARLCTAEVENEKKLLSVWKESEEAIRNAKAVGSAVGGDSASKVWMGTAMKLLELQRKRERAASTDARGSGDGGDDKATHPHIKPQNMSPSHKRATTRRTALVLPTANPADIDLDPSKFTAEEYKHLHDADGGRVKGTAGGGPRMAFFEDDGEPFPEHSDSEDEQNTGNDAHSQSSSHNNNNKHSNFGENQSYSSNGSGRIPNYQTPTANLYQRRMGGGGLTTGSAVSTASSVTGVGRGRGRRRRDVTSRDIQRTYRDQQDRMASARKMYSLQGLRARSASPGHLSSMMGLAGSASTAKRYGRSNSAPRQHFVSISNTGSKYSRTHNALWAHNSSKLENFWGSDYTKDELETSSNTFKHTSPQHSQNNSRSSSPTHFDSKSGYRSFSAPPRQEKEFSSFKSTKEWASHVLAVSPTQRGRAWHDPNKFVGGRSNSTSRGAGTYNASGHFMADTAASAAHQAHIRNKRQLIRHQHEFEYSGSNSHFMSDNNINSSSRGRTTSPGGYRNRDTSAGSRGGGGSSHARKQQEQKELNLRAQYRTAAYSGGGNEPSYSILRDGGKELHSISGNQDKGQGQGRHMRVTHVMPETTFMAPTVSSLHHMAAPSARRHIYEAHLEEYSPANAHSMSHVKPLKSHSGNYDDQYIANDDGMDVAAYQEYVAELARGMHQSNGKGGSTGTETEGWSATEVAEAEGEIEQLLAAIDEAAKAERDAAQSAGVSASAAAEVPHRNAALDILAESLERKRHAKSAVSERMAAMAAKAKAVRPSDESNPKGNTNINSSAGLQADTSKMYQEVEAAINGDR